MLEHHANEGYGMEILEGRNMSPPKSAMGFEVIGSCGVDSGLPSGFALRNEQRRLAGPVAAGLTGGSGAIETFCA
jgi:hypothetical protein